MKHFFTICITSLTFLGTYAQRAELKINITGINARKGGELRIAVYDKQSYAILNNQVAQYLLIHPIYLMFDQLLKHDLGPKFYKFDFH